CNTRPSEVNRRTSRDWYAEVVPAKKYARRAVTPWWTCEIRKGRYGVLLLPRSRQGVTLEIPRCCHSSEGISYGRRSVPCFRPRTRLPDEPWNTERGVWAYEIGMPAYF